ncbi:type II toxin-antitoxin system HipA family toxin [Adlercreutzia sp. ZJ141]|uniref:type II toxin-antitoxin system HipA family toxin n=1 Tax=Adlercreutzia sp. ZJ141 TaxID=2709406 RepID=UPI0013EAF2A9|nr:type II toxin-antitoxin system HipA family toxin [Adlercreutzia sp. ZJ141]
MKLEVYAEKNGVSIHAGAIETQPGVGESFSYDEEWLSAPDARPLSVTLPLQNEAFVAKKMRPYFEGLLPEGSARSALSSRVHVSYAAYVKLLAAVGRECIGAVSLQGPAATREDSYVEIKDDIFERLAKRSYSVAAEVSERVRFSLAGSQAKIALYRGPHGTWYEPTGLAPSTHILKPAGERFPDSAVNECICTLAAGIMGLTVPKIEILDIDGPIVCTERFDRDLSRSIRKLSGLPVPIRLHQEDFCQATGTVPEHKYEEGGVRYLDKVVDLIGSMSTDPVADLRMLWDVVAFNYLIGNCDAHLKNIALLRDSTWRELRLAPAYDLICTSRYSGLSRRMAMSIGGTYALEDVTAGSFENMAKSMKLPCGRAMKRLEELAGSVEGAIEQSLTQLEDGGVNCAELGEMILDEVRNNIARL